MSREIKFRAWDKKKHLIYGNVGVFPHKYVDHDGNTHEETSYSVDQNYTEKGLDFGGERSFYLEQYIGLHDKYDKAIYENDIIRFTEEDTASFVGPVEYMADDDYPAFDIPDKYIPTGWGFETNVISYGVARGIIEVIGNVHENLDLLEANK
ncbi:YopX protein [Lentilactobacillus sunkii]|jgi:uncharacterized phage protein (TIGR01671 family)|uniref:YopX protein n=1 Tax=Lentilactobacillus sunkii TaxID=481719 RepID=A0A1E7XCD5_9LACO|nr:YopX family protein [Lentilactobacillus sunkii]OFA10775.1 YopX protein [Lentilactobacillus sunkii]